MTTSVDIYKPRVAEVCVAAGAAVINELQRPRPPGGGGHLRPPGARLVLTHNPAEVKNKVLDAHGQHRGGCRSRVLVRSQAQGGPDPRLAAERVLLDPGIDLAKTPAQSVELLPSDRAAGSYDFGLPLVKR